MNCTSRRQFVNNKSESNVVLLDQEQRVEHKSLYLFLKQVVRQLENLHRAIDSGDSYLLCLPVECDGPDSSRHVVKEPDSVHLELPHSPAKKSRLIGNGCKLYLLLLHCLPRNTGGYFGSDTR